MSSFKLSSITNSIIIKSLILLIISMLLIVMIGTYIFTQKQMKTTLKLSYDTNETQFERSLHLFLSEDIRSNHHDKKH